MTNRSLAGIAFYVALIPVVIGCGRSKGDGGDESASKDFPDTLRVATLYSPMSYFDYRDETMGYDYSLVKQLAEDKGIELDLSIAPSLSAAIEMLDSGRVHLVAFDVPVTAEYLETVTPCGYKHSSSQVLVQKKGPDVLGDVIELVGKDIYVEKDTKFYHRLQNLNDELGGGINIMIVDEDSIISEDLLEMVSDGSIPFTVVDSDVARTNRPYFRDLDLSLQLSFPQTSSWAVSKNTPWLADSIDRWFEEAEPAELNKQLLRRYFELSRIRHFDLKAFEKNIKKGYISDYDALFKHYGKEYNIDWRLLAAISYAESKFDNTVVSWAGARGIMQIMPSSARAYGTTADALSDPEVSVSVASKMLVTLDKSLTGDVPDPEERQKFVLAAYNSGIAHIKDAINIARYKGLNPQLWDGNVAEALKLKSDPEIYNNKEVCRYGYFSGKYTNAYVRNVTGLYEKALDKINPL